MRLPLALTLLFVMPLFAEEPAKPNAAEPPELTHLREARDAAAKKALVAIDETYAKELDKLRDAALSAGKSAAAAAIDDELQKTATALMGMGGKAPGPPNGVGPSATKEAAVIPANTPSGFVLGPIKAGTKIELQYATGKWKSWGRIAQLNPDDPSEQEHGDASRLVIAESPKNGKPGAIIQMVPPQTKDKPYTYTFTTDYPGGVCLRIHDNSDHSSNPGEVAYKVKLGK
jgi:hypothetical protein